MLLARRTLFLLVMCALPASAQVTITVDAAQNRHAIDPRIYGVSFSNSAAMTDLSLPLNRWGGNTTTRYNWAISTANHARDWYFEVIPDDEGQVVTPGQSADEFIQPTFAAGAQAIITIPAIGYLPNTRGRGCSFSMALYAGQMGCCVQTAPDDADCGNGFDGTWSPIKGLVHPLDVASLYTSSQQAGWIQHNIAAFGPASTTGVKYYAIDNEPDLWDSTHFDVHPNPTSYDEIWGNTQDYGAMIKANDSSALTMGPEVSGWAWYFDSAYGWANGHIDYTNHGSVYFVPWLLQQAHTYEQQNGTRIIDLLSLHWYPQGSKATGAQEYDPTHPSQEVTTTTKLLRNQSTRSLWDPSYVDQSWIQDLGYESNEPHLIPLMRQWVNTYYPGTQIGITEYDWGDGNNGAGVGAQVDPNGATAQADVLGIFGREGLDFANRWMSPPAGTNVYNAFKIYRNYDGGHSKFGDINVSASSATSADTVSTFAALRSSDHALTIMVINKDLANTYSVTVNLANYNRSGNVQVWQLGATNTITNVATVTATPIVFNAPPETVNLLVVPGSYLDAPAGVSATATSSSTVHVQWNAVAGASGYQVYRFANLGGASTVLPAGTTSIDDGGLSADTTYLYYVVANSATASSGFSAVDAATTTIFADPALAAGAPVKAVHITQLRTAVNAMRTAANLAPAAFTDPTLTSGSTIVKAAHVLELRTALDQARAAIGMPYLAYTDAGVPPAAISIRAAHINDLRGGVQ